MINKRIEFPKNNRVGKIRWENYLKHFVDFYYPHHISLEDSLNILESMNLNQCVHEILSSKKRFIQSELLKNVYYCLNQESKSFAFTHDYEHFGMFLVSSREAIEHSFKIAKKDKNSTFFILDTYMNFYIQVTYYDRSEPDYPLSFDVKLCIQ